MGKTTRVLHNGHEFLLLDERRRGSPRTITCLVRDGDPAFAGMTDGGVVPTALGNWARLGIWQAEACRAVNADAEGWLDTVREVVDRYLDESRRHQASLRKRRYWYLTLDSQVVFCFNPALPHGLCLPVFSRRSAAMATTQADTRAEPGHAPRDASPAGDACRSGEEARAARTAPVGSAMTTAAPVEVENLADFLGEMAREGFAGALLDEAHPIYFCTSPDQRSHFLKLEFDDSGEVREFLLRPDGTWQVYEGDPELELFLDQDSCDATMVELLGDVPFHGFVPGLDLYTLHRPGSSDPLLVTADESGGVTETGSRYVPVFHEVGVAEEFIKFHDLGDHELRPVSNLVKLLAFAARNHGVARLQPEAHRARAAAMWLHDGEIILDSFSGFWKSRDGGRTYHKTAN